MFTDATPNALTFLAESPMVLCGIIPTDWLQGNMAEILLGNQTTATGGAANWAVA